jgi:hypothetical protein
VSFGRVEDPGSVRVFAHTFEDGSHRLSQLVETPYALLRRFLNPSSGSNA